MGIKFKAYKRIIKMEHLDELAQFRLNWLNTMSADDIAKLDEEKARYANEEYKTERMAEIKATFTANDTNEDQVLNEAEFANFMIALLQNGEARGIPMPSADS